MPFLVHRKYELTKMQDQHFKGPFIGRNTEEIKMKIVVWHLKDEDYSALTIVIWKKNSNWRTEKDLLRTIVLLPLEVQVSAERWATMT